ncbi:PREDICTED: uncharacterized protein LOC109593815 [Amphimedon queenslandica]|uniref:Death domain-containing protein n=1 Tax=Amphimedon queenslandica TaxID=400682 RepID=A0AAN0K4L9_AMPQE|nr:PREDICTED: uncharacterized protein LOC109593815 [Amphimedon queenslandica]|eukprot:XP_019864473.1 PREDICTED: uncharacterized protein LOC109593815 [Amphimedon queenslandica]
MRIKMDELKKIEKAGGRRPPDVCFLGVIELFLQNKEEDRKWESIFDALEGINNNRLKRSLEREYKPGDVVSQDMDAPSLVNKLVEATHQWYIFGEYLDIPTFKLKELRDETSTDVSFSNMMDRWYDSGDATIEVVIEALENLHNRVLAKKVRDNFLVQFEEQAKKQAVTWLTGVDEKILSEVDDVADIVEAVFHVNNWEDLGLALRIKPPDLEAIKNDNRNTSSCRREMIKKWLTMGIGSWKALCIALAKEHVGHINLAKRIAESHRGNVRVPENLKQPTQASDDHPGKFLTGISGNPSIQTKVGVDSITQNQVPERSEAYSKPEQATLEGNTETGAFSTATQLFQDPIEEQQ